MEAIKTYKVNITKWSIDKGEYTEPVMIPDKLDGYTSCGMWFDTELKLFAIGNNKDNTYCSNWDIYADKNNYLYSIARKGSGANNSSFGSISHIRYLISKGYWDDELTAYGKQLMEA